MNINSQSIEHEIYSIEDVSQIHSPGLLIYAELVKANIEEMIRVAGGPERLCPHCKTHKTPEITRLMLDRGIKHHKCATIAEAEMLATAGVEDILIAYQLLGPNLSRLVRLIDKFPGVRFTTLVDHPTALAELAETMSSNQKSCHVLIDLDPGMLRTGIEPGSQAIQLTEMAQTSEAVILDGLHWYDGHNRQPDFSERKGVALAGWSRLQRFRDQLLINGIPIDRIVAAGIGSFPILAESLETKLQLSPGTTTYFDADMQERFPEMNYRPAALILTRVISANRPGHLTLDVGHKACAADMPDGNRLRFPCIPDAQEIMQTEEHCVIRTSLADKFLLGAATIAIPRHACPTSAVHDYAHVISKHKFTETWKIVARGRQLSI